MIDQRTQNLGLPLPHQQNELAEDVVRLRDALSQIDQLIAQKADKAELAAKIEQLIGAAPSSLNTLSELAAALANNANYASFVSNELKRLDTLIAGETDTSATRFRKLKNRLAFDIKF